MSRRAVRFVACVAFLPLVAHAQSMDMQDMPGMAMPPADQASHANDHAQTVTTPTVDGAPLPPNDHVAPPPPQQSMQSMPASRMRTMMAMDDNAPMGMLLIDRLERSRSTDGNDATRWEAEGWYGNPIDRVWLKTEGEHDADGTQDARVEALWSHAWTSFWDTQLGVRHDFGQGPDRQWLAVGVEGLAPYWFETQATFYVGEQGRTALRLQSSYDMRFTQRLILAPQVELNLYGKDDPARGVSSGLSSVEAGMRLRYEFSRKLAPYVGVDWTRRWGRFDETPGMPAWHARETIWVAGVRVWL